MPKIKNKLFQPLTILVGEGKTLYLQSRQEAEVSRGDLDSPHLQSLIKKGDIALVEGGKEGRDIPVTEESKKPEPEPRPRHR